LGDVVAEVEAEELGRERGQALVRLPRRAGPGEWERTATRL